MIFSNDNGRCNVAHRQGLTQPWFMSIMAVKRLVIQTNHAMSAGFELVQFLIGFLLCRVMQGSVHQQQVLLNFANSLRPNKVFQDSKSFPNQNASSSIIFTVLPIRALKLTCFPNPNIFPHKLNILHPEDEMPKVQSVE